MDVRALRYFVETVRLASFTRAAQSLFVTQSTVSKMVRQLEQELGTPLLIRSGTKAVPTDTGEVVYARAQHILAAMRGLAEEVDQTTSLKRGRLTVGMPPMVNLLFAPVVTAFRAQWPDIALTLQEAPGPAIERRVADGELELGATVLPIDPDGPLVAHRIATHPIVAVGPLDVAWAGRPTLALRSLREHALLLPPDDFATTRRLRRAFVDAGIAPHIAAQSAHWDFLVSMAQAGLGVALLPAPLVERLRRGKVASARLVRPGVQWEIGHVRVRDRYLSHAARTWLQTCADVFGSGHGLPPDPA